VALLLGLSWLWPTTTPRDPDADEIIDWHAHTAGIGAHGSGIFLSPAIRESYKFPIYLNAFDVSEESLQEHGDAQVLARISAEIERSRLVSKAVILAMDGVVDDKGQLDRARTQIYIPNEFLVENLKQFPNLLFGASIHPRRPDALTRLRAAHANGAVLVKWLPAIMDIDPADAQYRPFYALMRCLGLPLLTHTGDERSFAHADDALSDPARLKLPLKMGVTVIAAHFAVRGERGSVSNFTRLLPLFDRYPNLLGDISALTQVGRSEHLARVLSHPALKGRIVYGSDWPLQFFPLVSPWYQWPGVESSKLKAITDEPNAWDRDVLLKSLVGATKADFTTSPLAIAKSNQHCE
jgi:hypothetical protein